MSAKVEKETLQERLRKLPQVNAILKRPEIVDLVKKMGASGVTRTIRALLEEKRQRILNHPHGNTKSAGIDLNGVALDDIELDRATIEAALVASQKTCPTPVLNGTGVIIHTNLGRAPLAPSALASLCEAGAGYSALEYDLDSGKRGSRHHLAQSVLQDMTGAEDAAVVNNCAAAVLLSLSALARDREVIISRGELVEIGGGFRVPDVMQQSGCHLVEVGTTNRTRPDDYERAITSNTALLLRVHRSNFELIGFTEDADIKDLAKLAHEHHIPFVVDAGSGYLQILEGCEGETTVAQLIELGVDLITFSGDKLLGGPQAGLIVGKRELVHKIRRHPLMRALRPDKLTLAALIATLQLWRDHPDAIPVVQMIQAELPALTQRGKAITEVLATAFPEGTFQVKNTTSRIGGGTSPLASLESRAVAIALPRLDALAASLRSMVPPLIGRIEDDAFLVDLRTIPEQDDATLQELLHHALEVHLS